jgi:hypothetical protein
MERRDVLKAGAIGAAAVAVAGPGCATVPHGDVEAAAAAPDVVPDAAGARAFLDALDRQLGYLEHSHFVDEFVADAHPGPRSARVQQVVAANDLQMKQLLRAALVSQNFRDLPLETQLHPDVQARIAGHMDELDETMFGVGDLLASLSPADHVRVRDVLRDRPTLAMDIGEAIDNHAAKAGLSKARRRQLRSMMMQTAFRLKHEAPGAVIDEYTAKVARLKEETNRSALMLAVSERVGQQAFWAHQKRVAQAPGAAEPPPPRPPVSVQPTPMPPPTAAPATKSHLGLKVGGAMLGIGVLVFGVSLAFAGSGGNDAALVGVTVGSILVGLGLLVLIISAIVESAD